MTHTVIHRHRFTLAEVAQAFGLVEPCMGMMMHMDPGGSLVFDLIEPGVEPPAAPLDGQTGTEPPQEAEQPPEAPEPPAEPEKQKGGRLAQRAGILCNERGFQVFLDVTDKDEARSQVCWRCGVASRAELDHNGDAADKWADLEQAYKMWLQGY